MLPRVGEDAHHNPQLLDETLQESLYAVLVSLLSMHLETLCPLQLVDPEVEESDYDEDGEKKNCFRSIKRSGACRNAEKSQITV